MLDQYLGHLEIKPKNPKLHTQVAEIYKHLGRDKEAFAHWREATELLHEQRAWEECAALCARLLEISPDDAAIRARLVNARLRQAQSGEVNGAIGEIQ